MLWQGKGRSLYREGNLVKARYREMLMELIAFYDHTLIYYFDIPFEETLLRHQMRKKSADFGEAEMKSWWHSQDELKISNEASFLKEDSLDEMVDQVMKDLQSRREK